MPQEISRQRVNHPTLDLAKLQEKSKEQWDGWTSLHIQTKVEIQ
jgi:hypothetical protein